MENNTLPKQVTLRFQGQFEAFHEDLSAIVLTPERHLWVGSDETCTVERLSSVDVNTFEDHYHFRLTDFIDLPAPADQEIDIEGLEYTNHYLWLVGSHSSKRKQPKSDNPDAKNIQRLQTVETEANRYLLARIPLVNGQLFKSCQHPDDPTEELTAAKLEITKKGNSLMSSLEKDPHLGSFIKAGIPGKDNGFDIEGIVVDQNRVFLGLRGPVLRGWAILLEIEIKVTDSTTLKPKKIGENGERYKKHFVNLGGLGIRDLCLVGQDLLILAGPTMDLDGPVKLFRLKDGTQLEAESLFWEPEQVLDLPYGVGDDHAEGMTLFAPVAQQPSVLVVYDSPAKTRLNQSNSVVADVFQLAES